MGYAAGICLGAHPFITCNAHSNDLTYISSFYTVAMIIITLCCVILGVFILIMCCKSGFAMTIYDFTTIGMIFIN